MTVQLPYTIDDTVYFLYNSKVQTGTVWGIIYTIYRAGQLIVEGTEYNIQFMTAAGDKDQIVLPIAMVFKSREDLLNSL